MTIMVAAVLAPEVEIHMQRRDYPPDANLLTKNCSWSQKSKHQIYLLGTVKMKKSSSDNRLSQSKMTSILMSVVTVV